MKILLLSGHGNREGARTPTISEKLCNQTVTQACKDFLQAYDCEVVTNNNQDYAYSTIIMRGYDLCVEIHHNAGRGDGAEVYIKPNTSVTERSKQFATILLQKFANIGQNSRGIKYNTYFGSLNCASGLNTPCVLSEFAFIDNANDITLIDSNIDLINEGQAYARAIIQFLGLQLKYVAPVPIVKSLAIGSIVKINLSAKKYTTGQNIPLWVKIKTLTVLQINIPKQSVRLMPINSWVNISDVTVK